MHCVRRGSLLCALFLLFCGTLFAACTIPVVDLTDNFTIQVLDKRENRDPVKIDFVWVIDNSNSMCEEQSNLAAIFSQFVNTLDEFINIDARMAVVTTNLLGDHGSFNNESATVFPPACRRAEIKKCLKAEDCTVDADTPGLPTPPGDAAWTCTWEDKDAATLENANGSVNSRCLLACTTDEECSTLFGEEFVCAQYPASLGLDSGCMVPPLVYMEEPTKCDGALPNFLQLNSEVSNLDLFPCIATVGAESSLSANLEQGMGAARAALDPQGPNAGQSKDFMRDDAWLVLIFISDEEDCSLREDCLIESDGKTWKEPSEVKECIKPIDYAVCLLQGDEYAGGPLEPVSRFVNFFKGLKADPGKVLVASIVGDSQEVNAAAKAADIEAFKDSISAGTHQAPNTYMCSSENGIAVYGERYVQLAEAFGSNGIVANICGPAPCVMDDGSEGALVSEGVCEKLPDDIDGATYGTMQALNLISATIIKRVIRVCLPKPVLCVEPHPEIEGLCLKEDEIYVERTSASDGALVVLEEVAQDGPPPGPGQYQIAEDLSCENTGLAVFFGDLLEPNDTIVVRYEADAAQSLVD